MAKKRPNPDFHKQLKPWKVEASGWAGWIKITCGWCGGLAYVKRRNWLHSARNRHLVGRSCTYCFKTGRIPGGSDE